LTDPSDAPPRAQRSPAATATNIATPLCQGCGFQLTLGGNDRLGRSASAPSAHALTTATTDESGRKPAPGSDVSCSSLGSDACPGPDACLASESERAVAVRDSIEFSACGSCACSDGPIRGTRSSTSSYSSISRCARAARDGTNSPKCHRSDLAGRGPAGARGLGCGTPARTLASRNHVWADTDAAWLRATQAELVERLGGRTVGIDETELATPVGPAHEAGRRRTPEPQLPVSIAPCHDRRPGVRVIDARQRRPSIVSSLARGARRARFSLPPEHRRRDDGLNESCRHVVDQPGHQDPGG